MLMRAGRRLGAMIPARLRGILGLERFAEGEASRLRNATRLASMPKDLMMMPDACGYGVTG